MSYDVCEYPGCHAMADVKGSRGEWLCDKHAQGINRVQVTRHQDGFTIEAGESCGVPACTSPAIDVDMTGRRLCAVHALELRARLARESAERARGPVCPHGMKHDRCKRCRMNRAAENMTVPQIGTITEANA